MIDEGIGCDVSGLLSVPSYATLSTLKKSIEQRGNVCPLSQKHLVQLDWVSKEDGSHILTVGVSYLSRDGNCSFHSCLAQCRTFSCFVLGGASSSFIHGRF